VNFALNYWNGPAFDILILPDFQGLENATDSSAETTLEATMGSYTVHPLLGSCPHTQGKFGNIAIIAKAGLILQDYSIPRQALAAERTTRANPKGIDPGPPAQYPKRLGGELD